MEQFPGGTSFIGDFHTATGAGEAPGTKGLPALGPFGPIAAKAVHYRPLANRVQFSGGCSGHVRGHRLPQRECPGGNLERRELGGVLRVRDATV